MMNSSSSSSNKPTLSQPVLPMRLYANWDFDRTSSPVAVQRILSMVFTRLVLTKSLVNTENSPITIAVRLQSNRRILRSNDLSIFPSRLDTPLDISFTIQYCHFIKRKPNILQILIQRRKRYKNRQIPGFKTLAMGHLNLDEILQFGGSREVVIWDTTCLGQKSRHSMRELHAGKISIANCFTQAVESTEPYATGSASSSRHQRLVAAVNEKEPVLSEEEQEEFSSGDDSYSDIEYTPRGVATAANDLIFHRRRQKKFLKQRNIKQRVFALLKKFRPDEEATTSECPHSSRSIVPPTEQELQEIFEELGNISDSGPELEPDKLSINSNPRPKIRPFFGSKSDIMPAIADFQNEEGLFLSDEISEDSELQSSAEEAQQKQQREEEEANRKGSGQSIGTANSKPTNFVRPLLVHSDTLNSMNVPPRLLVDPVEVLLSKFDHLPANQILPEHVWICSSVDLGWTAKVNGKLLEPVVFLDCPSASIVRSLLQTIVGKIQNFCNNNSISPPTTTIGVLGGDHLLANILKAYVHLLQDKACKEDWLNYLRFSLVLSPTCAIGRLLSQAAGFGGFSEAIWKVLCRVSKAFSAEGAVGVAEHSEVRSCLTSLTRGQGGGGQRCTNLQIGEVMLQLQPRPGTAGNRAEQDGKTQVFVPFLAELLTGTSVGSELPANGECDDPSFSSLYFIRQNTLGDERTGNNAGEWPVECTPGGQPATTASSTSQAATTTTARGYPTQHSQSSPSIPALTVGGEAREREAGPAVEDEQFEKAGNISPPRLVGSAKNSPAQPSEASRELQIEYWTVLNYPCSSASAQQVQQPREELAGGSAAASSSNVGGKFSMKASVRTLSIAREPMSNLLSILFVKERKKDKVLQKLGRRSKQKSIDTGVGFCPQSRVVSGVTRIVCTSGTGSGIGRKESAASAMDVSIDGVLWRGVRFFQIGAQWQTHVKFFPVSFPMELPVTIPM